MARKECRPSNLDRGERAGVNGEAEQSNIDDRNTLVWVSKPKDKMTRLYYHLGSKVRESSLSLTVLSSLLGD